MQRVFLTSEAEVQDGLSMFSIVDVANQIEYLVYEENLCEAIDSASIAVDFEGVNRVERISREEEQFIRRYHL